MDQTDEFAACLLIVRQAARKEELCHYRLFKASALVEG